MLFGNKKDGNNYLGKIKIYGKVLSKLRYAF